MSIDLAVAAFIWTVAAFVIAVPWRPIPPAPSLLFDDIWPDDCARLHERAQTGMRSIFGVLAAAAGLGSAIQAFQPHASLTSVTSLVVVLLVALSVVVGGRQVASLWERKSIQRRAEWLRAAEAAKYHVTPIPGPLAGRDR